MMSWLFLSQSVDGLTTRATRQFLVTFEFKPESQEIRVIQSDENCYPPSAFRTGDLQTYSEQ